MFLIYSYSFSFFFRLETFFDLNGFGLCFIGLFTYFLSLQEQKVIGFLRKIEVVCVAIIRICSALSLVFRCFFSSSVSSCF